MATGAVQWTFPVGDAVFGQPVVAGDRVDRVDRVLFGSRDGHVYAVSFEGRELYRVSLGGPVIASLASTEGSVFAASVPGRILCLDPTDGRERWRLDLNGGGAEPHVFAPLRIHGNRLYVPSETRTPGSAVGIV